MAQPLAPIHSVLPLNQKSGVSGIIFTTSDINAANNEAVRLTLAENKQYVVLTAVSYTDIIQPGNAAINDLVLPIVP